MLSNRTTGCSFHGIDFNMHDKAHLIRAAQEGIVFSFKYGIDIMEGMGIPVEKIHAGHANMFLSPIFRETLAGTTGATIELYNTDGAVGAARVPGWEQASTKTIKRLSRHSTSWKSLNPIRSGNRNMPMHMDVGNNAWPDLCR